MLTASLNLDWQPRTCARSLVRLPLMVGTMLLLAVSAPAQTGTTPAPAEQVNRLVAVLNSGAPQKEKADACRELARIGTKDAIPALAALLGDEQLSHMARYGLETIPDPAVDTALREALDRLHGRPLAGVIGSLGVRRDAQAVAPLSKRLRDPDADVAQAAARALGKIATPSAAQALRDGLTAAPAPNQLAFCEGLLRCADSFLAKGSRREALAIYDFLRARPEPHQVRLAALRGAVLARKNGGLPLLLEALRSPDFSLFAAATRISREMPGTKVTKALADEISKSSADKQVLLIQTLGNRGDAKAVPALVAVAQTGEKPVRLAALRALPEFGKAAPVQPLLALLNDSDRDIARTAQEGLVGIPSKEVDDAALSMLAGREASQQILGMEILARRRVTSAVPALFKAAEQPDPKVRSIAIKRLGELAGAQEIPLLLDCLTKARTAEELDALEQALGVLCVRTPDREACAAQIQQRLTPAAPAQKCVLLRVLTTLGGAKALAAVRAAVRDSDAQVHAAAIRALGAWNTADTAPDLLELARTAGNATDKALALRAYLAMAGHSDLVETQRLAMCREAAGLVQKDEDKRLLLSALSGLRSASALDLITRYLDDPAVKEEAATAVVNLAEPLLKGNNAAGARLVAPLEKVVQSSTNPDLQKRAKALLEKAQNRASGR